MADDLFIGVGTNAPTVVREVEASLARISGLFQAANGQTLNFGNIDLTRLQQLETKLRDVAAQAQRALAAVPAAERRAAAPGIFTAATAQAAPAIAAARKQLPLALQAADFESLFSDYLRNALNAPQIRQGIGRGAALSRVLGAAPESPELALSRTAGQRAFDALEAEIQKLSAAATDPQASAGKRAAAEARLAQLYGDIAADTEKTFEQGRSASQKRGVEENRAAQLRAKADEEDLAARKELARARRQQALEQGVASGRFERSGRFVFTPAGTFDLKGNRLTGFGEQDAAAAAARRDQQAGSLQASAEREDINRGFKAAQLRGAADREYEKRQRLEAAIAEEARQRQLLAQALRQQWQRIQGGFLDPTTGTFYKDTFGKQGLVEASGAGLLDMQTRYGRARAGVGASFIQGIFGSGVNGAGPADLTQGIDNLARTAGQTAKYALLFQALFGIQQAFSDTLQEARRLSEGVRDLDIAMGEGASTSEEYLNQLSEISRTAGANPSDAFEAAARGIRAFTTTSGDTANTAGEIERAGLAIADAANQISLITGKPLKDATGDVVAIASAFGLAATDASQVVDAIATARKLGGDPSQTSQGLANLAQVAKESGLTLQEAANAVSLVSARVDQSGQATATRIARLLSILGGTSGRSIIETINQANLGVTVDGSASQADQLAQVAAAYQAAGAQGNTSLQGLIRNAFGPANSRETQVIFENFEQIFGAQSEVGSGQEQFNQRMKTLDGLLKLIQGDITNLQALLVRSDIFAPIGAGLQLFEALLRTINRVLEAFNALTGVLGPARPYVIGAVELALLIRMLPTITAALSAAGLKSIGALGLGGLFGRGAGANTPAAGLAMLGMYGANPTNVPQPKPAPGSVVGGFKQLGSGLAGFAAANAPLLIAAALFTLYSGVQADMEELDRIRESAFDGVRTALEKNDLSGAANAFRSGEADARQGGGFLGYFTADRREGLADTFGRQATLLDVYAQAVERSSKEQAAALRGSSVFGDLAAQSIDTFSGTLSTLQASGQTATSSMLLLRDAIDGLVNPSKRTINAEKLSREAAATATDTAFLSDVPTARTPGANALIARELAKLSAPGRIDSARAAIESGIEANGGRALTDATADQIAQAGADAMVDGLGLGGEQLEFVRNAYVRKFKEALSAGGALVDDKDVPNEIASAAAAAIVSGVQAQNQRKSGPDQIRNLRAALKDIEDLRSRAADPELPSLVEAQENLKSQLLNAQIEDAQALIGALDAKGQVGKAKAASDKAFKRLALKALKNGDSDALIKLMENATNAQVQAVRSVIEDAIRTLTAAIMAKNITMSMAIGLADQITELQSQLGTLNEVSLRVAGGDGFGLGSSDSGGGAGDSATAIANARRSAMVAGSRKPVETARVEMINAAATMREEAAKGKNSVAYWNAVAAYRSAKAAYQDALREEFLALRDAQFRLGSDITDPVAQAEADLRAARAKLRADRKAGMSASVIAQDQLDVRQQQTNLEAAKFQQRLSDMQIAEQLGKISHAAYIRYLESERTRLMAIKNKTRQQIDMLNTIELELKNAMDMLDGQFNLGDIKLPTVYETRRAMAAGAVGATSVSTTTININGADTAAVMSIVSSAIGPVANGTYTITSRRA